MRKLLAIFFFAFVFVSSSFSNAMNNNVPSPEGYNVFVANNPDLAYTEVDTWQDFDIDLLRKINQEKNLVPYRSEKRDKWGVGSDCEDYVIEKIKALIDAGVPRGAMRISFTRINGTGHAVLVINAKYVLDSLTNKIFLVREYPYNILVWEDVDGFVKRIDFLSLINMN